MDAFGQEICFSHNHCTDHIETDLFGTDLFGTDLFGKKKDTKSEFETGFAEPVQPKYPL